MIKEVTGTTFYPEEWLEGTDNISRKLYLVRDDKDLLMLFYESSGTSEPDEHRAGNVYPLLGIVGVGKVGEILSNFYVPPVFFGWFAKHYTASTPRDGNIANFDNPYLYSLAMELETLRKYDFEGVSHSLISAKNFISLCDSMYQNKKIEYYPRTYIENHGSINLIDLYSWIENEEDEDND